MDLDSNAYYKLCSPDPDHDDRYNKIIKAIHLLQHKYDHETPEMWCSRIRDPFKKILKENLGILSGNGYITMIGKYIESSDRVYGHQSNYIYCSICDSLVFISKTPRLETSFEDNHLKRCINGDIISNEHARRKDILQSINEKEATIWIYKQYILQEEAKLNRLHLELFSQSTSHSEKDKLASISYDTRSLSYEDYYAQAKATIAENTIPSAPKFEPACISPARQEMVLPISHQSSNYKSDTGELFISSLYVKQPKGTVLRLGDGTEITVV